VPKQKLKSKYSAPSFAELGVVMMLTAAVLNASLFFVVAWATLVGTLGIATNATHSFVK